MRPLVPVALAALLVAVPPALAADSAPAPPPAALQPVPAAQVPAAPVPLTRDWRPDGLPAPAVLAPRGPLTPLAADLVAALDRQRERLAMLHAELAKAADPVQALAVQRRIEQDKKDTEIELLRVQLAHARRGGNTALAARLEAAIAEQLLPPVAREPLPRPVPTREDTR